MNSLHRFPVVAGGIVLASVASVVAAPSLPDQLVTHWNAAGERDGTMPKTLALTLVPVLMAALLAAFAVISRIDPLRENIASFLHYDWFVVLFTGFMLVVHGGISAFNLGYAFDFTLLILGLMAGLFYYVGILLTHAERNWFVGIRTPWTFESDEVWARTYVLEGRLFKLTVGSRWSGSSSASTPSTSCSSRRS